MPNIVQLWDFEDGTTQGWTLGGYSSLDGTGKVEGTYSVKYQRTAGYATVNDVVMSISGIDLSAVAKPLLVVALVDKSPHVEANRPFKLGVVVKDNTDSVLLDKELYVAHSITNFIRILIIDLSSVAGNTNLTIEIRERGTIEGKYKTRIHYFDMIAIIDGADYEYNTGIVTFDNDDLTISLDIPSSDGDLSSMTVPKVAVSLATPDWDYVDYGNFSFEEVDNQGSLKIDSTTNNSKHCNYVERGTAPTLFQKVNIRVWGLSIGAYAGWMEKVAVVFLDSSWNYKRIYLFNIYFTANGVSPKYLSVVSTTTYGSTVSGSRDINIKVHGNSLSIALKFRYLVGDPTLLSSGTASLTVYSSDKATNYGTVTVDLTSASSGQSSYITGLPTDTDLVMTLVWSITANARVVILLYPLVKVV